MKLYLYHVSQNQKIGYDVYSDFVCAAPDEETARRTIPGEFQAYSWNEKGKLVRAATGGRVMFPSWAADLARVEVDLIGVASEGVAAGVICASFHAG